MPVTQRPNQVEFRPPSKKTIVIIVIIAIAFFVLSSLRTIATFYTESLLFSSLGQSETFKKLITARLFIPTCFFVVTTLLVALTIYLATHFAKKRPLEAKPDEWIFPFNRVYAKKTALIRGISSLVIGLFFAGSTVGYYKEWILFQNAQKVGTKDPLFNKDVGFYLFELPFIRQLLSWLFALVLVLMLVAFVTHYVMGTLSLERARRHISRAAKIHLSILLAIAGLIRAAQYYFDRFDLVHSTRGAVDGATYTDVNAQLPAFRVLIFIAIIASIFFIFNAFQKGMVRTFVVIASWLIVSILIGTIYPLVIQTFVVKPSRDSKEREFTQRNIKATREAYGLDGVKETNVNFTQGISSENSAEVKDVLRNSLLWNEISLEPWVQQKRGEQVYEFRYGDRDRYEVDGKMIPSFVAAREVVSSDQLPDTSWQSRHITYSHGFGAAIANGISVAAENEPSYLVSDLPGSEESSSAPGLELDTAKARIYFGEGLEDFVFIGSNKSEQTPTEDDIKVSELGGVEMNSVLRKGAFALRYSDFNIFISDAVTPSSKIVFERDPGARIKKVAPFLDIDSNPYPVVNNGEVIWVVDAYTSSDEYPYSQYVSTDNLYDSNSLKKRINYVRNSVKATVNARTGDVKLYIVDKQDPIIKAYEQAFPKLFSDVSKAPKAISEHFRYPEDLFSVQTEVYADYHVVDASVLLKGSQRWQVAPSSLDDTTLAANAVPTTVQGGRADKTKSTGVPLEPLYQYVKHTGMEDPEFLLTRAFVPIRSSFKMDSFLSATTDTKDKENLRLVTFDTDADTSALSPTQMLGQINSDKEFSQQRTLLGQTGSQVIGGVLQIIPIADTVVYIQPIYVQGTSKDARPVLTYVTVSVSGRTVCAPTIDLAIDALVSGTSLCVPFTQDLVPDAGTPDQAETPDQPETETNETDSSDLSSLTQAQLVTRLATASAAYQKAKDPLDLGALQRAADEMVELVNELNSRD